MQNQIIDSNYQYFQDHRTSLVKKFPGQFVVISGGEVVGNYEDENKAYTESVEKYGLGNFLIQKCVKKSDEPKLIFHSRVIFS